MGRQKKNELDAILEQLKRSYATDLDTELEDSLLEEEKSDEDAELVSVLEKIFSSEETNQDDADTVMFEDDSTDADVRIEPEADENKNILEYIVNESNATESNITLPELSGSEEECGISLPSSDEKMQEDIEECLTEEERVDDVLNAMLRLSTRGEAEQKDEVVTDQQAEAEDDDNIDDECDASAEEGDSGDDTIPRPLDESASVSDEFPDEQYASVSDESLLNDGFVEQENITFYFDDVDVSDNKEAVDDEHTVEECLTKDEPNYQEEIFDGENHWNEDESIVVDDFSNGESFDERENGEELIYESSIVLDEDKYTPDELQLMLSSMLFFKPEEDLMLVVPDEDDNKARVNEESQVDESTEVNVADSSDVSLFMKFGYGNNTDLGVSEENIREVIVSKNNDFSPEKHKIIHGFTGKEYADSEQKQSIIKKFKSDRISLLVFSIIVSVLAVAMCIGDLIAVQVSLVDDYIFSMIIQTGIILAVSLILLSRLRSGFLSIIRSENNPYSWVFFTHVIYLIYLVWSTIYFVSDPQSFVGGYHFSIGGYVMLLTAFTVFAEYFDCCREADTFDAVSSENEYFVAEKDVGTCNSLDRSKSDKTSRYGIKRTKHVSGFFKRTSTNVSAKMNNVLIMSILLAVSVLVSIPVSIISESAISGSNSAILILLASIPLSSVIVPSLIEYINSTRVKKMNGALIGVAAVNEYSDVDSISFSDVDALEILSLTEINPLKDSENANKWSNMAKTIFVMLGGPISKYISSGRDYESNVERDLIINSTSENGIDLYFDSSVNVLMGDKFYMLSHNIKVKTDVKLTTAIKGSDRSIIYVAFDGVPRVGFIVTGRIKASFVDTLGSLHSNGIKTVVRTYEPQINESYFESNNITNPLRVKKTPAYENCFVSKASDSGVVASSSADLCHVILYSKKILKDRKKHKKIRGIQAVTGTVVALGLVALGCVFPEIPPMSLLTVFYCVPAILLIPSIIQIIKIIKRK